MRPIADADLLLPKPDGLRLATGQPASKLCLAKSIKDVDEMSWHPEHARFLRRIGEPGGCFVLRVDRNLQAIHHEVSA